MATKLFHLQVTAETKQESWIEMALHITLQTCTEEEFDRAEQAN